MRKSPQFARVVSEDEVPANSAVLDARCQVPQRLLKTVNRDDLEPVRVLLGSPGVLAGRDEEVIHTGSTHSDRLLLDSPDREDAAVERQLSGSRDTASVGDVPAELTRDLESEGKAR